MTTKKMTLFVLAISIFLFAGSCSINKAKIDNELNKYFNSDNAEGCFTMLNNSNGEITVYNMSLDTSRYSPAETFDIMHSLIALQTGSVNNEESMISWDHTLEADSMCKRDMNLQDAFKLNCTSFFQVLSKKTEKTIFQTWLDSISYGNKKMEGVYDSFWLNHTLTISPDEQLGFLKKLYFEQLPFRKSSQQMLRKMMIQEDNSAYTLSYKKGATNNADQGIIEWCVGWIEENKHVYFFVTFSKSKNKNSKKSIVEKTKAILSNYGFFYGKK